MNIIVYANGKKERLRKDLQDVVESKIPPQNLEVFHTIDDFSKRVLRLPIEIDVAVLLAQNKHELLELALLKDFLEDVRIILILPDRENETVSKGHKLRPCFLSYIDSDFKDVASVLEKILKVLDFRNVKLPDGSALRARSSPVKQ